MFSTPISKIRKIGPAYIGKLDKLGIKTIGDLFYHFPHRYEDFSKIIPISGLKLNEIATIRGQITEIKNTPTWKRKFVLTEAIIKDESDKLKVIWFNQPYLLEALPQNTLVNLSGRLIQDKRGIYLSNPVYEKIQNSKFSAKGGQNSKLIHTGRLAPIYPETAGLSSRWLRYIIYPLLPYLSQMKDFLPLEIKKSQKFLDLGYALRQIHFPDNMALAERARERLSFDELFLIQLSALKQKKDWEKNWAVKIPFNQKITNDFIANLSFQLTDAQKKAAWEIIKDLEKPNPMNRLLEGDVGSGKTIVAAIAALQTCSAGFQTALMAPTEILAQQHFNTFSSLFKKFNIRLGLLTGGSAKIYPSENHISDDTSDFLNQIKNGRINFLIGTHSLIQDRIKFKNLALIVIDEQHRFGVRQRAVLQQNAEKMNDGLQKTIPHLLSMTATPIPRTLALTIYGDLDISLLDEMPAGRQKIITKIIQPADRLKTYDFIRKQIKEGRQIFVICPKIENKNKNQGQLIKIENETNNELGIKAVKEEYKKLSEKIFPDLKIGMLHGKMTPKEKEKIIKDFSAKGGSASGGKNGKTDILVSTSVIEVGIDMPNVTVMMIEGAEKFGLAQLHQFRGRIGRGEGQSYCFIFAESPDKINSNRLNALFACKNGFELAEKDLEIRGPGEIYGLRQWGISDLTSTSFTNIKLVRSIRKEAAWLINFDPELKKYPVLKEKLREFKIIKHFE